MKIINVRFFLETVQEMLIMFAVMIVLLQIHIIFAILMTLAFTEGHNCVPNVRKV